MSYHHAAFVGSIPENYDRYLGPLLFEPYALDIVARLQASENAAVLELACGTGIVTRKLRDTLPKNAKLVATDLNEAMLEYARGKFRADERIELKQADATDLPFEDSSFDAVVCQFGLMFFPDKAKALGEVRRVLIPGGVFFFNVWGAIEKNELPNISHHTVSSFFEGDPPTFYQVPFGLYDQDLVSGLLREARFENIDISVVDKPGISASSTDAARGLIQGNPILAEIQERATSEAAVVEAALAAAIAAQCGDNPVRSKLQAIVYSARRPIE